MVSIASSAVRLLTCVPEQLNVLTTQARGLALILTGVFDTSSSVRSDIIRSGSRFLIGLFVARSMRRDLILIRAKDHDGRARKSNSFKRTKIPRTDKLLIVASLNFSVSISARR